MNAETHTWMSPPAAASGQRERGRSSPTFVAMALAIVLGIAACASLQESGSAAVPAKSLMRPYYGPPYGWR